MFYLLIAVVSKLSKEVKHPISRVIAHGVQVAEVCSLVIWTYCCYTDALDKKNRSNKHKRKTHMSV